MKSSTPPSQKIQHVVVLQENRTPDNLFPDAKLIAAGADIQNFGVNSKGTQITLTPPRWQATSIPTTPTLH